MPAKKKINNSIGPNKFKRDENGLIETIQYQFNEDGSVNWRAMVKEEYLYPNKEWFESREQEPPKSVKGLEDNQLLIKLGGIRELALLRGFDSVDIQIDHVLEDHVVAECSIRFIENYESPATRFTSVANATLNNVNGFCAKFLESIAENRAYVRCVRNFLNIPIVGADEIDGSPETKVEKSKKKSSSTSPQAVLAKKAGENGYSNFESFREFLRDCWKNNVFKNEEAKDWEEFDDIPAKDARKLIKLVGGK